MAVSPVAVQEYTTKIRLRHGAWIKYWNNWAAARVDFIKVDIEGAELSFLRGAGGVLCDAPRPTILAEVQDIRTRPWGYAATELAHRDGNFLAVPEDGSTKFTNGSERITSRRGTEMTEIG
jgi:methyltransferase FkbM-like protein